MTTSIFIKSYRADFPWLEYALKSIDKYTDNFLEVVLVLPEQDRGRCQFKCKYPLSVVYVNEVAGKGYLQQQAVKLQAHNYIAGDYVLFTDSDTMFTTHVTPSTYVRNYNPYILKTSYAELGNQVPWKPIVEKCLGFEAAYEYMRRQPFMFWTKSLEDLNIWYRQEKKSTLHDYIMSQPHNAFSEYNVLGAWLETFQPYSYLFIDTAKEPLPELTTKQFWSYSGITESIKEELDEIVK